MFTSLDVFQSAQSMARHAAKQQSVVAGNLAHANTPGFKAMTLPERAAKTQSPDLRSRNGPTHAAHFAISTSSSELRPQVDPDGQMSPNGNSVSIEAEMLKSIDAERQHKRAMTVYQSALTILRTSIGR
jgi:flagellar basal-body rod protein FlgB